MSRNVTSTMIIDLMRARDASLSGLGAGTAAELFALEPATAGGAPQFDWRAWLEQALQAAIELELSTLPPYLCGMWSIKKRTDPVFKLIHGIVFEEMLHLGLACNILAGLGGKPDLVNAYRQRITYPGGLPGGVRPWLRVYLAGISQPFYVKKVYMEIEWPESDPTSNTAAGFYPTIGDFYDAIADGLDKLYPDKLDWPLDVTHQVKYDTLPPFDTEPLAILATKNDAVKAITEIKQQGEGNTGDPQAHVPVEELAHYYKFQEIAEQKTLKNDGGKWVLGDPKVGPADAVDIRPMLVPYPKPVPKELDDFDALFLKMLTQLDSVWATGGPKALDDAIGSMVAMGGAARAVIAQPYQGGGFYGPDFVLP